MACHWKLKETGRLEGKHCLSANLTPQRTRILLIWDHTSAFYYVFAMAYNFKMFCEEAMEIVKSVFSTRLVLNMVDEKDRYLKTSYYGYIKVYNKKML